MGFSDIISITIKILAVIPLGYVLFVFFFQLFLKSLLKKPGHKLPNISRDSWHFKLAYPLDKYNHDKFIKSRPSGIGFLRYSTRLFIMFILGWPAIIALQTVKMIIYTPILILIGRYPIPNLSLFDVNIFASELKAFYIPSIYIPKISPDEPLRLYPILFVIAFGYGLMVYMDPTLTFLITLSIFIVIFGIISFFYLADSGFFKNMGNLVSMQVPGRFSEFIRRHDSEIMLNPEDDEDKII